MRAFLAAKVLLPLFERSQGRGVGRFAKEVRETLGRSPEAIRQYQLERVRAMVRHAVETVPYYADLPRRLGIGDFGQLDWETFKRIPPVDKETLRERGEEFLSRAFDRKGLVATLTGGTTALPMRFYMDKSCYTRRWAATRYFDQWLGNRPGGKMAYLWGAPHDMDKRPNWKWRLITRHVLRRLMLPCDRMDAAVLDGYIESLLCDRPECMQAYPSAMEVLCRRILDRGMEVPIPNVCCTAEVLTEAQIEMAVQAFGTAPRNWYGAREAGRIATECEPGRGMHVNSYGLVVEVDAPEGEIGDIYLTDLWNLGMPVLRYRIGDLGRMSSEPCPCGCSLPRLTQVVGRTVDFLTARDGRKVRLGASFKDDLVQDFPALREIQVIQEAIGSFQVLAVQSQGTASELEIEVTRRLNQALGEPVQVDFRVVDQVPRSASGKLRFCINKVSGNGAGDLAEKDSGQERA